MFKKIGYLLILTIILLLVAMTSIMFIKYQVSQLIDPSIHVITSATSILSNCLGTVYEVMKPHSFKSAGQFLKRMSSEETQSLMLQIHNQMEDHKLNEGYDLKKMTEIRLNLQLASLEFSRSGQKNSAIIKELRKLCDQVQALYEPVLQLDQKRIDFRNKVTTFSKGDDRVMLYINDEYRKGICDITRISDDLKVVYKGISRLTFKISYTVGRFYFWRFLKKHNFSKIVDSLVANGVVVEEEIVKLMKEENYLRSVMEKLSSAQIDIVKIEVQ